MQEKAGSLERSSRSRGRCKKVDDVESVISEQSLGKWHSFLKDMCGGDVAVVKNICSMFTFEPLHNLHLGMSRFLKTCVVQYFSFAKDS